MYLSNIHPEKLISNLSEDEIVLLYNNIIITMKKSYEMNGRNSKEYKDLYGNVGKYDTVCYDKNISSDGSSIIKILTSDKRITYISEKGLETHYRSLRNEN